VLPLLPLLPPYAFFALPISIPDQPDLKGTFASTGVEFWACLRDPENHYSPHIEPRFPYPQSVALRVQNFPYNLKNFLDFWKYA
jgi:hypothetical protein